MIKPANEAFYKAWLFASKVPILTQNHDSPDHTILLYPGSKDKERALKWDGDIYFDGSGTKDCPFQISADDISPHFGIFEMWFVLCNYQNKQTDSIYIEINDYIFRIVRDGVVAKNGRCTRLLLEN